MYKAKGIACAHSIVHTMCMVLSTTCYQPTILVSNITENTKHLVVFYNKLWYKKLAIT